MHRAPPPVRARRVSERGFTLVELMAVVVVIGILAAVAVAQVKKYVEHSKTTEAVQLIGHIMGAQEYYKGESEHYLPISNGLTASTDFYPNNSKPGRQKMNFPGTGTGHEHWDELDVHHDAPVLFVYGCTAGAAGTTPTATGSDITVANWPSGTADRPWYVIKAKADLDGDGVDTVFMANSYTGQLFSAND